MADGGQSLPDCGRRIPESSIDAGVKYCPGPIIGWKGKQIEATSGPDLALRDCGSLRPVDDEGLQGAVKGGSKTAADGGEIGGKEESPGKQEEAVVPVCKQS